MHVSFHFARRLYVYISWGSTDTSSTSPPSHPQANEDMAEGELAECMLSGVRVLSNGQSLTSFDCLFYSRCRSRRVLPRIYLVGANSRLAHAIDDADDDICTRHCRTRPPRAEGCLGEVEFPMIINGRL